MDRHEQLHNAGAGFVKEYAVVSGWMTPQKLKPGWYVARASAGCVPVTGVKDGSATEAALATKAAALRTASAGSDFAVATLVAETGEFWFYVDGIYRDAFTAYAIGGGAMTVSIVGVTPGAGEAA